MSALLQKMAQLNALDDKLIELIGEIENALAERINVRIEIDFDADNKLAFGKFDGRWCLLIKNARGEIPLRSAPRESRCCVVLENWPARLLADADRQLDEMITRREGALDIGRDLIKTLRRTK